MKALIKQLLREGLTGPLEYRIEHMGYHHGQDDYELGVYLNDDILGMVQYTIYDGELTVRDIIVLPKYRRLGIGSKMMQYVKQQHPDAKYVPSMMTDLGVKFKHKHHDDLHNMMEDNEEFEVPDYAVIEIMIPIAYLDPKYYYQAVPVHQLDSDRIYIWKGSAGGKSISTKSVRLLKTFKYTEKDEMEAYLKELRSKGL
jgi:GNAT superfamily N-acetyltransferase